MIMIQIDTQIREIVTPTGDASSSHIDLFERERPMMIDVQHLPSLLESNNSLITATPMLKIH